MRKFCMLALLLAVSSLSSWEYERDMIYIPESSDVFIKAVKHDGKFVNISIFSIYKSSSETPKNIWLMFLDKDGFLVKKIFLEKIVGKSGSFDLYTLTSISKEDFDKIDDCRFETFNCKTSK